MVWMEVDPNLLTDNSKTCNPPTLTQLTIKTDSFNNWNRRQSTLETKKETTSICRTSFLLWSSNSIVLTRRREDKKTTTRLVWRLTSLLSTLWGQRSTIKKHFWMSVKSKMLTYTLKWIDLRVNLTKCAETHKPTDAYYTYLVPYKLNCYFYFTVNRSYSQTLIYTYINKWFWKYFLTIK